MSLKEPLNTTRASALALLLAISSSCSRGDVNAEPWKIDEAQEMSAPDLLEMGPSPMQPLSLAQKRSCTLPAPPPQCRIQRADSFGDCGVELGAVFDGTQCVPVTGCECTGEDCPMFESLSQCAIDCSAQGWCQADKINYNNRPPGQPRCDGELCDTVFSVCIKSEVDPSSDLNRTAPNLLMICSPRGEGSQCWFGSPNCSKEDWCCHGAGGHWKYNATNSTEMCALSLLATSTNMTCIKLE